MIRRVLAQHFLLDREILHRIIRAADLSRNDTVIEIGSGRGVVTRELVKKARRVVAIEVDSELARSLSGRLGHPPNLTVLEGDARTVDLDQTTCQEGAFKVVGNLPYYAANPIIRRFLEACTKPALMVVMVQKEVAEVMVAVPGKMRLLSVGVQFYGIPRIVCIVPPIAFKPVPKVSSAVMRIDLLPQPSVQVDDVTQFFSLVQAGFSAPRKQLRNSLAMGLGLSSKVVDNLLEHCQIVPQRRPETLTLEEWACLYRSRHDV